MPDDNPTQAVPAPLTDAYHKARRNLALFSGILIGWEYIGLSLGDAKSGATGKLPGDVVITIKNPEVMPVVVALLVLYFLLRQLIEWHQCDLDRRLMPVSRIDLFSTIIFAGISILLFAVQTLFGVRLADFLSPGPAILLLTGGIVTAPLGRQLTRLFESSSLPVNNVKIFAASIGVISIFLIFVFMVILPFSSFILEKEVNLLPDTKPLIESVVPIYVGLTIGWLLRLLSRKLFV